MARGFRRPPSQAVTKVQQEKKGPPSSSSSTSSSSSSSSSDSENDSAIDSELDRKPKARGNDRGQDDNLRRKRAKITAPSASMPRSDSDMSSETRELTKNLKKKRVLASKTCSRIKPPRQAQQKAKNKGEKEGSQTLKDKATSTAAKTATAKTNVKVEPNLSKTSSVPDLKEEEKEVQPPPVHAAEYTRIKSEYDSATATIKKEHQMGGIELKNVIEEICGPWRDQAEHRQLLSQPFCLQVFLDNLYDNKDSEENFLFRSLSGSVTNSVGERISTAARICRPWRVQWEGNDSGESEDDGGFSRALFSKAWPQLSELYVQSRTGMKIPLFETSSSYILPRRDKDTEKILEVCDASEDEDLEAKVYAMYEAIGRLLARCVLSCVDKHVLLIADYVVPGLLRNYIFRDTRAKRKDYELPLLMSHVKQLISDRFTSDVNFISDDLIYKAFGSSNETEFRHAVESEFVQPRKKAIKAIMKGFHLSGSICWKEKLQGFSLETIQKMFFAKPNVEIDDFVEGDKHLILRRKFRKFPKTESKANCYKVMKYLASTLEDGYESNAVYLEKFLVCCTGQSYLPYPDFHEFTITIEFNYRVPDSYYPQAYACERTIVFPGGAYEGNRAKFDETFGALMASQDFLI